MRPEKAYSIIKQAFDRAVSGEEFDVKPLQTKDVHSAALKLLDEHRKDKSCSKYFFDEQGVLLQSQKADFEEITETVVSNLEYYSDRFNAPHRLAYIARLYEIL